MAANGVTRATEVVENPKPAWEIGKAILLCLVAGLFGAVIQGYKEGTTAAVQLGQMAVRIESMADKLETMEDNRYTAKEAARDQAALHERINTVRAALDELDKRLDEIERGQR